MPEASSSVVIPHPVPTVWDYLSTTDHVATFLPGVVEMHDDGTPLAVGVRWWGTNKILGKTADWSGTFTRVEDQKLTDFATDSSSSIAFTSLVELEEVDGGTRYTYTIDLETGLGGIFGKLADPVVIRVYQHALTGGVDSIPDLIDSWLAEKQ